MLVQFRNKWQSGLARLPKVTWLSPQLLIKLLHDTRLIALRTTGTNLKVTISAKDSEAVQLPRRKWGKWSVSHFYRQRNPRESPPKEPTYKLLQLCKLSRMLKSKKSLGPLALQTNMDSKNWAKGLLQQCLQHRRGQEKAVISLAPSEKLSGATKVFIFLADLCLPESMFSLPVFITEGS